MNLMPRQPEPDDLQKQKQVTIHAIVNFCPFSILFALEEVAVSVAPLLVFRWLDRLLRRFIIHVAASVAHLPSPMSTSLYPLLSLSNPFRSITLNHTLVSTCTLSRHLWDFGCCRAIALAKHVT